MVGDTVPISTLFLFFKLSQTHACTNLPNSLPNRMIVKVLMRELFRYCVQVSAVALLADSVSFYHALDNAVAFEAAYQIDGGCIMTQGLKVWRLLLYAPCTPPSVTQDNAHQSDP